MIEREDDFDVVINAKNELMICIRVREGEPENPKLMYDGGDHALLVRAKPNPVAGIVQPMILLDFLDPDVRPILSAATEVLLVEVDRIKQLIHKGYSVPVNQVSALPVPEHELDALADYKEKMREYVEAQEIQKLHEKAQKLQQQAKAEDAE